ncbi:MAG TPA: DsrE family protein [Actinomycetota bacterium]|nr:DsrE family protein [Actinomycetota bacterium]
MDDDVKRILYVMTHGVESPERCATPFFLSAAAAAMENEVSIYFTMNGPTLLRKGTAEKMGPKGDRGQPLSFFIDQALDVGVNLYVCQPSLDLHDMTMGDLIDGVKMIGGAAFNNMATESDAVISF